MFQSGFRTFFFPIWSLFRISDLYFCCFAAKSIRCCFVLLVTLSAVSSGPALAKDDALEFLHRMEKGGFADITVDYLNDLKNDPDNAPPAIMRIWELEMSAAKREKARTGAYGPEEARRLMEESKQLLDEFIKSHPTFPEAIQAAAEMSKDEAAQAQIDVLRALAMTDKAQREALLAAARAKFEKIRPHFAGGAGRRRRASQQAAAAGLAAAKSGGPVACRRRPAQPGQRRFLSGPCAAE